MKTCLPVERVRMVRKGAVKVTKTFLSVSLAAVRKQRRQRMKHYWRRFMCTDHIKLSFKVYGLIETTVDNPIPVLTSFRFLGSFKIQVKTYLTTANRSLENLM